MKQRLNIEGYDRYQAAVLGGEVLVCKEVRQAIERQARDLERQRTPDFPYYFDRDEAERVLTFLSILRCTSGAWKGKRIPWADFQIWRNAVIFGWRRVEDDSRRFRTTYIEVSRKNGKTEEAAAISVYGLVADGELSPEVYAAATNRDQARRTFKAAKAMVKELVKESVAIKRILQILSHRIVNLSNDGYMVALSGDADGLDGLSPSMTVVDEFHAAKTSDTLEVLESGQGARLQPLLHIITTAGFNIQGPCYQMRSTVKNILAGILEDESFFGIIYTLDEDDDWKDETKWVKPNPNIGVTPRWSFMRDQATKAKTRGKTAEVGFKTKNLNLWVASSTGWIKDEAWMECTGSLSLEALRGRPCFGGLDLASTSDFTSFALFFPDADEEHKFLWWHWIPDETYNDRLGKMPSLAKWRDAGLLETTPGSVLDYDYIEKKIVELSHEYDIQMIGIDPHNALQLRIKLEAMGLPVRDFSQSIMNMSPPTKEFARLVGRKAINHGSNPVIRWMLGNVHLYTDANDNIKVHKGRSAEKVDGVVAAIMAVGEWMSPTQETRSYLDDSDLLSW